MKLCRNWESHWYSEMRQLRYRDEIGRRAIEPDRDGDGSYLLRIGGTSGVILTSNLRRH